MPSIPCSPALAGILLYVAFRFEVGYGVGAVIATVHDVLMTVGIFVLCGQFGIFTSGQFTAPMLAAILMIVGYSINDTIVVFDRIREELELNPGVESPLDHQSCDQPRILALLVDQYHDLARCAVALHLRCRV
jgi:preprotein translocase SecF subunit